MIRWLRRFFYSDDPVVKLAASLSRPTAESWRELLANGGVVAMVKNMSGLAYYWGGAEMPFSRHFDLFVKESDLERALEVIGPMIEDHLPADEAWVHELADREA